MFGFKIHRSFSSCRNFPALFAAIFILSVTVLGQTPSGGVRELELGKTLKREINKGDLHEYKFALRQGQVLFVELEEQTYDVKIQMLRAADKTSAAETNLGNGFDRENILFAAEDGEYILRIEATENQFGTGSYRFKARVADSLMDADRTRIEALGLLSEAVVLQKENTAVNIREAIKKREQALTLWQKIGDKYWEGRTLDRLGAAHNALLENNKAVEYFDRALEIVKKSGDKPLEAATLNTIGSMTNGFGEYEQAIKYHNQALQIFQKLKNDVGIMSSQNFLGNSYAGLKDYPKANEYFQKSLEIAQKERNRNFEASGLWFLGTILEAQNDKANALVKYNESLSLWKEINSNVGIALALFKIGQAQNSQKQWNEALSNLNEALRLSKLLKIRWLEADIYFELSSINYEQNKISEAVELLKKSAAYYQEFKIRTFEIIQTGLLAIYYENLPDFKEAIKYAETALAIEEIVPEKSSEARTKILKNRMKNSKGMSLLTLGRVYFNSENPEKAIQIYQQTLEMFEAGDDIESKQRVLDSLGSLAQIHQYRYEWNKALENYNRALETISGLEDTLRNKVRKILTLNSIGLIYKNIGEQKKSLEYFEKAIEATRLIPDQENFVKNFEASILNNIGLIYLFWGETGKALETFNGAIKIQEQINDTAFIDSLATSYGNIAQVYSFLGENQKALSLVEKSLELYRQTPQKYKDLARNRTAEATILNNLGYMHKIMGDFRKASDYYSQSLSIAIAKKREDMESTALNNIALIYQSAGEPRKALQNLNRALEIEKRIGEELSISMLYNNIGLVYSDLGDELTSIKYLNQSLEIAEKTGNKERTGTVLNNLGRAYTTQSENEKALSYFNRALKINKEIGNKSNEAVSLNNLAILYSNTGERGKAIEYFEQALAIVKSIGAKSDESNILGNIALDYQELGEYEKALEYREKSLKNSREIGDKLGEILQLNGIGSVYLLKGEKEKKEAYFKQALISNEQALKLSRESENKYGEFDALLGLGKAYIELNETAKAFSYLNEALDCVKKIQSRFLENGVHFALGKMYEKTGALDKAAEEYQQAFTIAHTINDKDIEAKALKGLMSVWKARKNNLLAIFYGKQSVNKYQELRGSIRNLKRETQDVFRDKITDAYRELADLLIEAGRLAEAEQVLAMLKEQENFEFARRDASEAKELLSRKVINDAREQKAVAEYARLADELIAKSQRKNELEQKGESARTKDEQAEYERLVKEVDDAFQGIKSFFSRMETEFARKAEGSPIDAGTVLKLRPTLDKIRRDTGENVIVISTYLLPERFRAIITTPDTVVDRKTEYKSLKLDGKAVNEKILEFKQALQNPKIDPRPLGKELYDIFIKPLERDIVSSKAKTILWSLDGNLRYVPVAALYDGEKYLAERYENAVITLGLTENLFTEPKRDGWRVLGLGVSKEYGDFRSLPGVPLELGSIIRDERDSQAGKGIFPGISLLNDDFTDRSFSDNLIFKPNIKPFNIVHLATHFRLQNNRDNSGILLGDGKLLSLYDFNRESRYNFAGVDLLTLSACETGVSIGDSNGGEVESLGMLAQQKGAKAVLATLWKVADASTAMLMSEFYRLRQANPAWTKAKALREAQLAMISGKLNPPTEGCENRAEIVGGNKTKSFSEDKCRQFSHPYYWSPFVLIGNWR